MIDLTLQRKTLTAHSTIGALTFSNAPLRLVTLEDTHHDKKIPGDTCIRAGMYDVIIRRSPHFGCRVPLLLNVPDFEDIEIHRGNSDKDSRGCILVGISAGVDYIYQSVIAFQRMMAVIDIEAPIRISIFD